MLNLTKILVLLILSQSALARSFRHVDNFEKGHVRNPILFLKNDTPPIVNWKPSQLLWITFPIEVKRCAADTDLFTISKVDEDDKGEAGSVKFLQIKTNKQALDGFIGKIRNAGVKTSIYSSPMINVNCMFAGGDIVYFLVKISKSPYNSVKFLEPADDKDLDVFRNAEDLLSVEPADGPAFIPAWENLEADESDTFRIGYGGETDDRSIFDIVNEDDCACANKEEKEEKEKEAEGI